MEKRSADRYEGPTRIELSEAAAELEAEAYHRRYLAQYLSHGTGWQGLAAQARALRERAERAA